MKKTINTISMMIVFFFTIGFITIAPSQINNISSNKNGISNRTKEMLGTSSTEVDAMYFYNTSIGWVFGNNGLIAKTTDGGAHWIGQSSHTNNFFLKVFFVNPNIGWACGYNGTFLRTTNGGDLWTLQALGTSKNIISVFFLNENKGWVVGDSGLILSTQNGGINWAPQTSGTENSLRSIKFIDSSSGWVVGSSGCILHTINGGVTWTPQNSNTEMNLWNSSIIDSLHGYIVGTDQFYSNGVFLNTTNGGASWLSQTPSPFSLFDLGFVNAEIGWVVGIDGYILKTTDGGNKWISQRTTDLWLSWASFLNSDTGYVLNPGTVPKLLTTTDGGNSWFIRDIIITHTATKLVFGQEPTSAAVGATINPPVTVIIEDTDGNIVSNDNMTSVTLTIATNPGSGILTGGEAVTAINGIATFRGLSINKLGTGYTLIANCSLELTSATSTTFNITPIVSHAISITDVPNDNGKQVFIKWVSNGSPINSGITNFSIYRYDRQAWTYIKDVPVLLDSVYQTIAPTIYDSTITQGVYYSIFRVIAHTSNESIYKTIGPDSGYSVDNLPPLAPTDASAMQLLNGNNVIQWHSAVNIYGDFKEYVLYRSLQSDFIPSPSTRIAFVQDTVYTDLTTQEAKFYYKITSKDYAGNESQSIAVPTSAATGVKLVNFGVPKTYDLAQNYPNPFNPSTQIQFSIIKTGYITLKVFNVSGQVVSSLISQEMTPGTYNVLFSAKNLSSGMYFYKLQAGTFSSTKKMLILK